MKNIFSQKKISSIIQVLVLIADAGLIIRIGIIKPYTLEPFEFFIIIASFLLFLSFGLYGIENGWRSIFKKQGKIFGLINLFLVIGLLIAWVKYGLRDSDILNLVKHYYYFFTVYAAFIFHLYYGREENFRKKALYMLSLSVIFIPFLLSPTIAQNFNMIGDGKSFLGLSGNPSLIAIYLLIPLALFLQKVFSETQLKKRILYWIITILIYSLVLWTGSRGTWVASIPLFAYFIWFYTLKVKPVLVRVGKMAIFAFLILISVVISFSLLGHIAKVMALDRVIPITNYHPDPKTIGATKVTYRDLVKSIKSKDPTTGQLNILTPAYQDRQNLWPQALRAIAYHPAGLGLEYARMSKQIIMNGQPTLAHNSFLQAALSGGIALLILIIVSVYYISKKIYQAPDDNEKIFLFGLWISLIVGIMFNDHLFLPWVWVIAGIILGKTGEETKISEQ